MDLGWRVTGCHPDGTRVRDFPVQERKAAERYAAQVERAAITVLSAPDGQRYEPRPGIPHSTEDVQVWSGSVDALVWNGYALHCPDCGSTRVTVWARTRVGVDGQEAWMSCPEAHVHVHPLVSPLLVRRYVAWAQTPFEDRPPLAMVLDDTEPQRWEITVHDGIPTYRWVSWIEQDRWSQWRLHVTSAHWPRLAAVARRRLAATHSAVAQPVTANLAGVARDPSIRLGMAPACPEPDGDQPHLSAARERACRASAVNLLRLHLRYDPASEPDLTELGASSSQQRCAEIVRALPLTWASRVSSQMWEIARAWLPTTVDADTTAAWREAVDPLLAALCPSRFASSATVIAHALIEDRSAQAPAEGAAALLGRDGEQQPAALVHASAAVINALTRVAVSDEDLVRVLSRLGEAASRDGLSVVAEP